MTRRSLRTRGPRRWAPADLGRRQAAYRPLVEVVLDPDDEVADRVPGGARPRRARGRDHRPSRPAARRRSRRSLGARACSPGRRRRTPSTRMTWHGPQRPHSSTYPRQARAPARRACPTIGLALPRRPTRAPRRPRRGDHHARRARSWRGDWSSCSAPTSSDSSAYLTNEQAESARAGRARCARPASIGTDRASAAPTCARSTADPGRRSPAWDALIRGEGEEVIPQVLRALRRSRRPAKHERALALARTLRRRRDRSRRPGRSSPTPPPATAPGWHLPARCRSGGSATVDGRHAEDELHPRLPVRVRVLSRTTRAAAPTRPAPTRCGRSRSAPPPTRWSPARKATGTPPSAELIQRRALQIETAPDRMRARARPAAASTRCPASLLAGGLRTLRRPVAGDPPTRTPWQAKADAGWRAMASLACGAPVGADAG